MNIFLSGSISIKQIPSIALEKIDSIMNKKYTILLGDANGIDLQIQKYLVSAKYQNVVVYYAGEKIRKNLGDWSTKQILPKNNEKGRAYTH